MKRLHLMLGLLIFLPRYAHSGDVATFDIQGFSLGDQFSEIKEKFPCKNQKIKKRKFYGKIASIYVQCNYNKDGFFEFRFGHNQKILSMSKIFWFKKVEPDYEDMREKLVLKYGEPTVSGKSQSSTNKEENYSMCWGNCIKSNHEDNRYWEGTTVYSGDNGKSLLVKLSINTEKFKAILSMDLSDEAAIKENHRWQDKIEYEEKKKKRKKVDILF